MGSTDLKARQLPRLLEDAPEESSGFLRAADREPASSDPQHSTGRDRLRTNLLVEQRRHVRSGCRVIDREEAFVRDHRSRLLDEPVGIQQISRRLDRTIGKVEPAFTEGVGPASAGRSPAFVKRTVAIASQGIREVSFCDSERDTDPPSRGGSDLGRNLLIYLEHEYSERQWLIDFAWATGVASVGTRRPSPASASIQNVARDKLFRATPLAEMPDTFTPLRRRGQRRRRRGSPEPARQLDRRRLAGCRAGLAEQPCPAQCADQQ